RHYYLHSYPTRRSSDLCSARRRTRILNRSRLRARAGAREKMTKLSLRDLDVRGKRVLVRADFNVPTENRGGKIRITDDTRIRETDRKSTRLNSSHDQIS